MRKKNWINIDIINKKNSIQKNCLYGKEEENKPLVIKKRTSSCHLLKLFNLIKQKKFPIHGLLIENLTS